MELSTLIRVLRMRENDNQCSKDFARFLSITNVYLQEKQQFSPLYSNYINRIPSDGVSYAPFRHFVLLKK